MKTNSVSGLLKAATADASSRWPARGTANRLEPECWPVLHPSFRLPLGSTVYTIGSCFARNIEAHLATLGFRVPTVEFFEQNADFAGAVGSQILNRYTPPAIHQELLWTRSIMERDDIVRLEDIEKFLLVASNGKVLDLHVRADNQTFVTPEEALRRRRLLYSLCRNAFTSDVVVITLGLIECWLDLAHELYVEFTPVLRRHEERFKFVKLDYPTALGFVKDAIDLIKENGTKVLLTTSPVPLGRTFTGDDVIIANTYSKSVLRAIAGYIADTYDCVDYFPSYESVMLTKRPEVWQNDLIHIEAAFVGRVMARVVDSYVVDPANNLTRVDAEFQFINAVNHKLWDDAESALALLGTDHEGSSEQFYVCRAEIEQYRGNTAAALSDIARATELLTGVAASAALHLRCARVAEALGEHDIGSQQRSLTVEALRRQSAGQWMALINTADRQGYPDDAEWLAQEVESHLGDDISVLNFLSGYYSRKSRDVDARRVFQKLADVAPDDPDILARFGWYVLRSGQTTEAIGILRRSMDAGLQDLMPQRQLAHALVRIRDYQGALPLLRKIADALGDDIHIQLWLAQCCLTLEGPNAALPHVEAALSLDPTNAAALALRDRIQRSLPAREKAVAGGQ
jgi:tetratricopeptide (TPR) repeat protein